MTLRTPQGEVFWALLSSSEHSGVPEDSNSRLFQVLGFTPTLGQSRGATLVILLQVNPAFGDELEIVYEGCYEIEDTFIFV
jgi:hypothetical protein